MRLKFFQSSSSSSASSSSGIATKTGTTSLDDSSFISTSSGASQSSWKQQRAATEPRRGMSPYKQQQEKQSRPKTFNTVMQIFDDNQSLQMKKRNPSKGIPATNVTHNKTTTDNPYRVKANGAVVINRTNMIDSDDLLLVSGTLSSHISAASSLEASVITTHSAKSVSVSQQPITTASFFEPGEYPVINNTTARDKKNKDDSNKNNDNSNNNNDNTTKSAKASPNVLKPLPQKLKMRMESNSSRSTFPLHDTTRFSTDGDSLCSMESWSSSMVMDTPDHHYISCEQDQHHHVTALSPPPRNTAKKWERGRACSNDIDDVCEALTTLNDEQEQLHHYYQSPPEQEKQGDNSKNWRTMFELANQENIRLRHQLQAERNGHHEIIQRKTEALSITRRENKYLRHALSRIQMLSNTDAAYNKEKRRRQSTGEIAMLFPPTDSNASSYEEPSLTLSNRAFHGSVALSYDRKIKILLDEIEGMQADEEIMYMKRNKLFTKNAMLEQQLLAREESVKQLEHDLCLLRLQCQ